jgi:hypothetical protein
LVTFGWIEGVLAGAVDGVFLMHNFLIALVFVAMVAYPAIIAYSPKFVGSEDR